jgi:RNase adapter protein RapZ
MSDAGTQQPVVLVSGFSGAGKASILRALEDIGFEAVDNPPLEMIDELVSGPRDGRRIAIGVDCRSRGFEPEAVLATLARLRVNPALQVELVFAWANETVLLRRFTETRRRHPMAPKGRINDGIRAEQRLFAPLHQVADVVIDTSDLPPATLRQRIEQRYGSGGGHDRGGGLALSLISFAFPAGLPQEAETVLDARFLRNPHYDPTLRQCTGLDPRVGRFVEADPYFAAFYTKVVDLLELLLPRFVQEGKKYASIAVGCTGGRHRSVHIVEKLAAHLTREGWRVTITHRELGREAGTSDDRAATQQNGDRTSGGNVRVASSVQAQEA